MLKRITLIAAVFAAVAMAAHAAAPLRDNSSPMSTPAAGWDAVSQAFRSLLLDVNGALVVSGNFSIASATINSVQPFVTPSGVASSSKMDTSDRLVVNVGSQSGTLAVSVTSLPAVTATPTVYAPTTDARGRVGVGVTTVATTSLTVPLLLTAVCAMTQPCLVEVSWNAPVLEGLATTTAATYATTAHTYASGGEKSYLPGVAGWDRGFLATGTVGQLVVTVWPLLP